MKAIRLTRVSFSVAVLLGFACSGVAQIKNDFRYTQFPAGIYRGHLKTPSGFHKDRDGNWWDEAGKPASKPRINFAGEYFLTVHSCGTCCRYYSLNNLKTGTDVSEISEFDADDSSPIAKDGHRYIPVLFYKPDSKLLMVQYVSEPCETPEKGECRQRYFVFDKSRFRAISSTIPTCKKEDEPAD